MNTIKDAWMMVRKDLRGEKKYLLWSFIFAAYMGGTTGIMMLGREEARTLGPVADFILLMLIPMLGFYFSRRSFKYLTEDSYTQMLAFFRVLPISNRVVLAYRVMQSALAFVVNGIIFFIILHFVPGTLLEQMRVGHYLAFALTWIGYGFMMTGPYIYFEFSNHGKAYLLSTLIFLAGSVVAAAAIFAAGGNLLMYTVEVSERWGLLSPVMWGMLLAGAISLVLCSIGTLRRLESRDLV
ncbi:hypothetical protein [Paenibacillus sp. XY044]|uniref:hypothetical protein n=1 Tax=Paenibacillus sp. XY044 TaxID=2026089 RepID=UPI0015C611BD|nr:hypothetical protein [Paenibacillus sp. XY044]